MSAAAAPAHPARVPLGRLRRGAAGVDALLGAGFLAHAAWDAIHHEGHGPTRVRTWYPPFCVVAGLAVATPLLTGWL